MDWLAKFLKMPTHFLHASEGPGGGVIQGSASEAVLVAVLAAREQAVVSYRDYSISQRHPSHSRSPQMRCVCENDFVFAFIYEPLRARQILCQTLCTPEKPQRHPQKTPVPMVPNG